MVITRTSTWIEATCNLTLDITVMTVVECPHPLRGANHTCPDIMMIGAHTTRSGGGQSTQESHGLMQGPFWCKVWWTGIKHIEKGKTEIARLEAECMFLVPSVLAEPSGLQRSLPTSGWRLELVSSLVNRSLTLGLRITEWLYRSVVKTMRWP